MPDSLQDALGNLEEEGKVPDYLKNALISEVDFIRDSMQIVSLFGGFFFDTALRAFTTLPDAERSGNNKPDPKRG